MTINRSDIEAFAAHPALKPVYRNRRVIGHARSWGEVATLLGDTRRDAAARLSRENSEGPTGFFLKGE